MGEKVKKVEGLREEIKKIREEMKAKGWDYGDKIERNEVEIIGEKTKAKGGLIVKRIPRDNGVGKIQKV